MSRAHAALTAPALTAPRILPRFAALLVFALVAALAAGHAGAATRIPAGALPGDDAPGAAAGTQSAPSLAAGGGAVLALWSDARANSTGGYEGETSADIYGQRFDEAGAPLDAVPFPVVARRATQALPRAAWNGANWLVVYESVDLTGTGGYYQTSLEAVRVSPAGAVLDARPIRLFNMQPVGGTWAVASDGTNWVVVNQGTSSAGDLAAQRVSAAGVLLDPAPRSLVAATYYLRGRVQLEHAGGVFLLAYEESMTGSDPTTAIRFDGGLNRVDPAPFPLLPATIARLASSGGGFYAVWTEQLPDWTVAVKGSRIGVTGQRLDGTGVVISGPNPPQAYTATSVAWDGAQWKVTWQGPDGARLARVSAAGQVLDPGGVLLPGVRSGATAGAGNGSLQVAWSEYGPRAEDVFTAYVSASNAAGPVRTISIGAPAQMRPDVAAGGAGGSGGTGWMIAFRSSTATRDRILAQPLDATGTPATAAPVELDAADGTATRGFPAVAWNGAVYLVAWDTGSSVVARRVAPDGTPLDAAPVVVMTSSFGPVDVEALGDAFLVVGLRCGINCQYINPVLARVRGTDGALLDPAPIVLPGTYSSTPVITTLGGRWLVVRRDNWSHDECGASTVGTFVDAAGTKGTDFSIHGPYSSCGGNGVFTIGLASSGGAALMVQSQELTSGVETDLLARRILPDGTVGPAVNLTPWGEDQYRPRVAWDGTQFVVVWQDQRDGEAALALEPLDARGDLFGMRISEAGAILDPQGFVLSNSPFGEAYPNVAARGGVTLFAASVLRQEAPLVNYRVRYERLDASANAWPSPRLSATPSGGDVPLAVGFSSAGSADPEGQALTYTWDLGDGATSSAPAPLHVYEQPGPFLATLEVRDTGGAAALQQALVRATAPNLAPVAVAASDRTHGPAPLDVTFSAAGSYDPDGWVGNIEWAFGEGSTSWGSTAYHTYTEAGTYPVTVTVHDASGATGTASLSITVDAPFPPAAPSNLSALAFDPQWINLTWTDASNSEDGFEVQRCAGNAAACGAAGAWAEIARVGRNIDYYGDTGLPPRTTYSYRVRAFNGSGTSAFSNVATATTPTYDPVAVIAPSVLNGAAPLPVTFDGRGSYDPDGTIASYSWAFGDGATGNGPVVTHTYAAPGWFNAVLTVTDDAGATGTAYSDGIHVVEGNERSPATGDAGTGPGSLQSGSYLDTRTQNDVAEVIVETSTGTTPGTRRSQLEHTWSLTVAAGHLQAFYVDAWHSPNGEGDHFVFEYSMDGVTFTPMLTVTKTADDDALQSFPFPAELSGPIWIRVRDLDRTAGRGQLDRVSIDEMFVSSSPSTGRSGEVAPRGAAAGAGAGGAADAPDAGAPLTVVRTTYGQLTLAWGASCVASDTDYGLYAGPIDGAFRAHAPLQCSTGGLTTTTINPPDGNVYFLVVPNDAFYEGRYGTASSGADVPGGATRCWPAAVTAGCP